ALATLGTRSDAAPAHAAALIAAEALARGAARRVGRAPGATGPFGAAPSADGRLLCYQDSQGVPRILKGGVEAQLPVDGFGVPAFAPDGTAMVVLGDVLHVFDLDRDGVATEALRRGL